MALLILLYGVAAFCAFRHLEATHGACPYKGIEKLLSIILAPAWMGLILFGRGMAALKQWADKK